MAKFVKEFLTENRARTFAQSVGGVIDIRYSWNEATNQMIKIWIVRY